MLRKILIANRGEIACRIIRTCREMGIATVAVFSEADANALHVQMADEAVLIGPASARESYLNIASIISAAQRTGADAIHPGYGFLSENAEFARACVAAGLVFIGPTADAIERMGSKREAKRLVRDFVPVVPGYEGDDQRDETFISAAASIGYPVMVKASAGGGGKGMRVVDSAEHLPEALAAARREALQAFGDDTLILEKYIQNPRHIEIQIFGDMHGTVIALGERECSIQRRHQKIIEESPSPALTEELRQRMEAAAVRIGEELGYVSAGTVEFIVDSEHNFYFLEVNTRLQVEHPVTELRYSIDLVQWQIYIAESKPIPHWTPYESSVSVIEIRLYAENPFNDFLPATGDVLKWYVPSGIIIFPRVDAGIQTGDQITVYYDPMLAKIIAWEGTREETIRSLDYALSKIQLLGLHNNLRFLRRILNHPEFIAGNTDTGFIERHPELLETPPPPPPSVWIAAGLAKQPIDAHWRNNPNRPIVQIFEHAGSQQSIHLSMNNGQIRAQIGAESYEVRLWGTAPGEFSLSVNGHRQPFTALPGEDDSWWIHAGGETYVLRWVSPLPIPQASQRGDHSLRAPMPGQILKVYVEHGQVVQKEAILLVVEAMKMEHRIRAPYNGRIAAIHYQTGQSVQAGAVLLEIEPETS